MARKVEKVYFDTTTTLRLDGIRVVRVTWPVEIIPGDYTELRAYGPRGFIGMIRSAQHPELQNKLVAEKFLDWTRPQH